MQDTLLKEITALANMPYKALKERWRALYGTAPPAYSRQHMIRRLAYRLQELAYGGLSDDTKAELEHIAAEDDFANRLARKRRRKPNGTQPIPGTRLVREWSGQRHEVTAVTGGFEYSGRRYRSLSAIAKAITGAHWSGPQFFGLRTAKKDAS